ncbi:Rpn family recombination-promoting nuclease/putative transposase [Candidatus Venteria ishoeyi]|uniref:Transposase (putative) YhgA-like domain-containing protein n=1 Tax=Candidatus Venteria ishoeyi TaxID=1899563 RepID=A0A1H6F8B0_9GAMM|nr:Rpn family recombination-promoting nuclease/putative transposase [Candidatus Venteria ishoeyi]SEH05205.1 Uncharacterised protein [Candidatus Venteria ishoeyi]
MPKYQHDASYKNLFSHPQMVQDLLQGFVHEQWVEQVDFTTLEKCNNSYITDDLRDRESDIVWKVKWGERSLYIYLLIEFQSTIDYYMPLRINGYVNLFYQDLVKTRQIKRSEKLPAVFPVVLYNGKPRWNASCDISELIESIPGLEKYQPQMHYFLIDEGLYDEGQLKHLRNLVAALFRLEKSRNRTDIQQVLDSLIGWLQGADSEINTSQKELQRAFVLWLQQVLLPRQLPDIKIPEMSELQEMRTMLAETVQGWYEEAQEKGLEEGLEKGIEKGLEKGLEEGLEKGDFRR